MSDLASPLLFVQCEEAVAYLCFCSLMRRISCNFKSKSVCQDSSTSNNLNNDKHSTFEQSDMLAKLQNLYDLLLYLDPQLAMFLREKYLGNFFFAHRWILLEMKREFSFLDSLRLLEVQWASLPQSKYNVSSSSDGVSLVENGLADSIISGPLCPQHCINQINKRPTKIRCYAVKDMSLICSLIGSQYTPYEPVSPPPIITPQAMSQAHFKFSDNQNVPENDENSDFPQSDINESDSNEESILKFPDHCICSNDSVTSNGDLKQTQSRPKHYKSHSKSGFSDDGEDSPQDSSQSRRTYSNSSNHDEALIQMKDGVVELPPPEELGHGNPFLLFLCVSLLLEYREVIFKGVTEASDMLMLYQKFNQRHNTTQVLNRARMLYDQYLRDQEIKRRHLDEFPEIELTM